MYGFFFEKTLNFLLFLLFVSKTPDFSVFPFVVTALEPSYVTAVNMSPGKVYFSSFKLL